MNPCLKATWIAQGHGLLSSFMPALFIEMWCTEQIEDWVAIAGITITVSAAYLLRKKRHEAFDLANRLIEEKWKSKGEVAYKLHEYNSMRGLMITYGWTTLAYLGGMVFIDLITLDYVNSQGYERWTLLAACFSAIAIFHYAHGKNWVKSNLREYEALCEEVGKKPIPLALHRKCASIKK